MASTSTLISAITRVIVSWMKSPSALVAFFSLLGFFGSPSFLGFPDFSHYNLVDRDCFSICSPISSTPPSSSSSSLLSTMPSSFNFRKALWPSCYTQWIPFGRHHKLPPDFILEVGQPFVLFNYPCSLCLCCSSHNLSTCGLLLN